MIKAPQDGRKGTRIAWFTSARDPYAADLLRDAAADKLPIELVVSEHGPSFQSVQEASKGLRARFVELPADTKACNAAIPDLLRDSGADVAVFVGYMKKISKSITEHFPCLNLHPAPPLGPIGRWEDVTWSLIATSARETGCMIHVATDNMDRGPIVSYCLLSIDTPEFKPLWEGIHRKLKQSGSLSSIEASEGQAEPLFAAIRSEQFAREGPLVTLTLRALTRREFSVTKDGLLIDGKLNPDGICLTRAVEEEISCNRNKPNHSLAKERSNASRSIT